MSIGTLLLGDSGTGKSASMRNLDPAKTLLIQSIKKPLPFKSKGWGLLSKQNKDGSLYVTDQSEQITRLINGTSKKIIVIDDWQYILANEYMRRANETGFSKFTDIGRHAWDVLNAACNADDDKRVYILCHTDTDEHGTTRAKTIGKLLNEKITVEGMFSIVLRTSVMDGSYQFSTKNNGSDTVKSPIGLFETDFIDNDLQMIDQQITSYYEIEGTAE